MLFGGVRGFNFFDPTTIHSNPNSPPIVFTDFLLFNKSVIPGPTSPLSISIEKTNTIELSYEQSIISFSFVALNYTLPEKNEYAYRLEGFNKDWQYIGSRRYITFTNIPAGTYILTVKGCNNDGLWNEEGTSITLIIRPPFWETWWFRLLLTLLTSGIIYGMYKLRIRSIKQQNRLLEAEVVVRTEQIVNQRNEIARQKELVEQKNHDITSSIRYAQRIQESTLPEISEMKSHFKDAFVFYRPKDIVSGDFYWFENTSNDNTILFAVADCTGHGVPGAMVSVLGNNGLNRSVNELGLEQPAEILNNLNLFIQRSFEKKDQTVQDGMDIALCQLNLKTKILLFSGANNSAWIARNNEMFVLSGTKQPIGNYRDSKSFDQTSFQLESEDWLFLFSDGYADQFGGPRGKKLKYALFNTILLNYDQTTDGTFEDYLSTSFDNWKGDLDQIDDVCVLGLKIR